MNIRQILPVLAFVAAPLPAFAAAPIEGTWMLGESDNASKIRIAPCGAAKWCGTVIWSKQQDASKTPLVDAKTSNPALRTRKIVGLTVLTVLSNL